MNIITTRLVASHLILSSCVGFAVGDEASGRKDENFLNYAATLHAQSRIPATEILKEIRHGDRLTQQQFAAIEMAGRLRDAAAMKYLIPLVLVQYPDGYEKDRVIRPENDSVKKPPTDLADYPAATALLRIGLPAVGPICVDLEDDSKEVSEQRLKVCAHVVSGILGTDMETYLRREQDEAPSKYHKLYDELIEVSSQVGSRTEKPTNKK